MNPFFRLLCLCLVAASAQAETASPLLQAMQEELTRSVSLLEEQPVAPYFLSYEITETQGINVRASFGALTYSDAWEAKLKKYTAPFAQYGAKRLHHHGPHHSQRLQRAAHHGVPHLHRWTRRTRARRGSDRHTAHRLQPE